MNDPPLSSPAGSSSYGTSSILVVVDDDDSQDSVTWLTIDNNSSYDPQSKLILYKDSRDSILKHTYWLHDSQIYTGQILLKRHFPLVNGLHNPAITGPMVIPAKSEFIQIVNIGAHWVCISTLRCQASIVRVFESWYSKPSSVAINHACHMQHHPQNTVTFLNEKVQKQVGSSDCALFALAFATDLCYGLDPTSQRYSQKEMRQHYVTCLESGAMVPFQKLINEYHFIWAATASRYQSFAFAGSQKMGKSMWNVFHAMACTILTVSQNQNGPLNHGYHKSKI